jgi:hypothetical protein
MNFFATSNDETLIVSNNHSIVNVQDAHHALKDFANLNRFYPTYKKNKHHQTSMIRSLQYLYRAYPKTFRYISSVKDSVMYFNDIILSFRKQTQKDCLYEIRPFIIEVLGTLLDMKTYSQSTILVDKKTCSYLAASLEIKIKQRIRYLTKTKDYSIASSLKDFFYQLLITIPFVPLKIDFDLSIYEDLKFYIPKDQLNYCINHTSPLLLTIFYILQDVNFGDIIMTNFSTYNYNMPFKLPNSTISFLNSSTLNYTSVLQNFVAYWQSNKSYQLIIKILRDNV